MKADGVLADELGEAMGELLREAKRQCRKAAKKAKPKPVHHARTALRRLEVAVDIAARLELAKRKKALALRDDLHALEGCLGDTRDDDVLAEAVNARKLPELASRLARHRAKAAKKMRKTLRREDNVLARARRFAKRGLRGPSLDPKSPRQRPVLVRHRVMEVLADGLAGIVAYDQRSPVNLGDDAIHKVRGAARALRFTVELFEGALPPSRVAAELHALQSRLGKLHDHVFALERVGGWLEANELEPSPSLRAWLDAHERERQRLHAGFAREWRALMTGFQPRLLALSTDQVPAIRPFTSPARPGSRSSSDRRARRSP